MTEHNLLKFLANDLENENEKGIKGYIIDGHSIRDAILYIDVYLKKNYLLEIFKKYAVCKICEGEAIDFLPEPRCRTCRFRKEMNKIEFGKSNTSNNSSSSH